MMRRCVEPLLVLPALVIVASLGLVVSCGPNQDVPQDEGLRIVSLSPALSQMLVDLGLGEQIVGVAMNDAAAPPGPTVVGNYASVQTETLLSLQPTHVLTLVTSRPPPRRLSELADEGRFTLVSLPYPRTIQDVADMLAPGHVAGDDDRAAPADVSLGRVLGQRDKARQLRHRMLSRLEALRQLTADREPVSVLIVIGTQPIMATGPGTVHDQLLGYVGAVNAASHARVAAPTYDRESLLALAPQVILLLRPGAPALEANDVRLTAFQGLAVPAVRHERIAMLNNPLVMLESSALDLVAADMARAIHPDLADQIDDIFTTPPPSGQAPKTLP